MFALEPPSSQSSTRTETHPVVLESSDEDDKQTTPKRKKVVVDGADRISDDDHANVLMLDDGELGYMEPLDESSCEIEKAPKEALKRGDKDRGIQDKEPFL